MRRLVVIHQPDFLPYLGFFHRLVHADVFIVLDDVQFIRRGWHHRDKIKTRQGEAWLTLSIEKGDYNQLIRDVRLSPHASWIDDNLNLIRENYGSAPYFDATFEELERRYRAGHARLVEFNVDLLGYLFDAFAMSPEVVYSSKLAVSTTRTERLVDLVKAVGGTDYLSGLGSKDYLREELFADQHIKLHWQQFQHPVYPQLHGEFVPKLSAVDFLFNCGVDQARRILRSC